jgi:signal transduction histidine kinase
VTGQALKLVAANPEKVRRTGAVIARQVAHMTSLINDLLDVARVTRGLITLEQEIVDLRQVLSAAAEQVNPMFCARKHHLLFHLPP